MAENKGALTFINEEGIVEHGILANGSIRNDVRHHRLTITPGPYKTGTI